MFDARFGFTLALCAGVLHAEVPFSMKLADLSDAWFAEGTVIHVPPKKCPELQVRLAKSWSDRVAVDQLELELDGKYPRFDRATNADGLLLIVRTREPLGLLPREEHHLIVSAGGRTPLRAEWTIQRWEKAYILAMVVGRQGSPIDIGIDQPPGGLVLAGTGTAAVRFAGEVLGSEDSGLRLTIAGEAVKRVATLPGFHFDQRIKLPPDSKEVVVVATDGDAGDSTTMVLRVLAREAP